MSKQLVTPELAQSWIDNYTYEKELMESLMRNIRSSHVNFLAGEMEAGLFGTAVIVFADCADNGRRFIINGNHTLRAIVKSQTPVSLAVDYNQCQTIEEVRHLYATYDKNLNRKRDDSLRAYDASKQLEVKQSDLRMLSAAVNFMLHDYYQGSARKGSGNKISDLALLDAMRPWAKPFGELLAALSPATKEMKKRIFNRRAVLAVALPTVKYQASLSLPFWYSVAMGTGLVKDSAALRLRDYLMETHLQGGGNVRATTIAPRDMAKTVAFLWNKHYAGLGVKSLRVSGSFTIAGAERALLGSHRDRGHTHAIRPVMAFGD